MSVFWVRFDICPFKFDFLILFVSCDHHKKPTKYLPKLTKTATFFMNFSKMQLGIWKIRQVLGDIWVWYLFLMSFDIGSSRYPQSMLSSHSCRFNILKYRTALVWTTTQITNATISIKEIVLTGHSYYLSLTISFPIVTIFSGFFNKCCSFKELASVFQFRTLDLTKV